MTVKIPKMGHIVSKNVPLESMMTMEFVIHAMILVLEVAKVLEIQLALMDVTLAKNPCFCQTKLTTKQVSIDVWQKMKSVQMGST